MNILWGGQILKRYYNSSDERKLNRLAMAMFQEVSIGIYYVAKDRTGIYPSYVNSDQVMEALNHGVKIAVTGNSGIYANFELIE